MFSRVLLAIYVQWTTVCVLSQAKLLLNTTQIKLPLKTILLAHFDNKSKFLSRPQCNVRNLASCNNVVTVGRGLCSLLPVLPRYQLLLQRLPEGRLTALSPFSICHVLTRSTLQYMFDNTSMTTVNLFSISFSRELKLCHRSRCSPQIMCESRQTHRFERVPRAHIPRNPRGQGDLKRIYHLNRNQKEKAEDLGRSRNRCV